MKRLEGFRFFQDKKREWRWQLLRRGRVVAVSGEGYKRVRACRAAVASLRKFAPVAPVAKMTLESIVLEGAR